MSKFILALVLLNSLVSRATPFADVIANPAADRFGFVSHDGLSLNYVRFDAISGTSARPLVIAPGAGESAYRYDAFVTDLLEKGFGPIYVLEHRGQGYSEGHGRRADLVHIDHFEDYVTDFTKFMRGPVAKDLAARGILTPPYVIAHSMGGAIANLALAQDQTLVRKIVYVAPMMDINTSILNPLHDRAAYWAAELLCAAGLCESLAVSGLGRKRRMAIPGVPRELAEGIFRGGVTPGWLKESIRATWLIHAQAPRHTEPSLVIAARGDRLVQNKTLRRYAVATQNCDYRMIDGPHGLHHDPLARVELVSVIDGFLR